MVPTQLFKAVYDPARKQAGAYMVDNTPRAKPIMISIADLEKASGIAIFPSAPPEVRDKTMPLLEPRTYKERRHR